MPSKPDLISIHETSDPKEAEFIQEKLNQYNLLFAPPDNHQSLTLLARDQKDNIIAGLVGVTYWGWLHIEIFGWMKACGSRELVSKSCKPLKKKRGSAVAGIHTWRRIRFRHWNFTKSMDMKSMGSCLIYLTDIPSIS